MNTWHTITTIWIFVFISLAQVHCATVNCTTATSCNACRESFKCSWCSSPQKCVDGTIHGLGNPKLCEAKNVYREFCCNDATDCKSCAGLYGCSWCAENNVCLESAHVDKCEGTPKDSIHQCTTIDTCQHYSSCHECVTDSNCGWCEGSKKCLAGASVPLDTSEKCPSGWTLECPEKCEQVVGTSEYCETLPPKVCSSYGPLDGSSFNMGNHYFATILHDAMMTATCLHHTALPLDKELYCSAKSCQDDSDCRAPKKMCHSLCMDCFKSEAICDEKVVEGMVSLPGESSCSYTIQEKKPTNFGISLKNAVGWNIILLSIWWAL